MSIQLANRALIVTRGHTIDYRFDALELSLMCPTDRRGSLSLLLPRVTEEPVSGGVCDGVEVWRGVRIYMERSEGVEGCVRVWRGVRAWRE